MVYALRCYCCQQMNGHEQGCPVGIGLAGPLDIVPRPANHPSVLKRFQKYIELREDRVLREDGSLCHCWTGGRSRGGMRFSEKAIYGTFNPGGEIVGGIRAHIYIAWVAGIIDDLRVPVDMNLDHRCVNSLCVNPHHLELVTKEINQWLKYNRV